MWIQWRLQICVFVPEGWCNSLWFLRLTEVRRGQNFVKINICLAEESLFGVKLMILVKITHSSTPWCCSLCQSWDNFHHLDSLLAGLFLLFVVNIMSARLVLYSFFSSYLLRMLNRCKNFKRILLVGHCLQDDLQNGRLRVKDRFHVEDFNRSVNGRTSWHIYSSGECKCCFQQIPRLP